MHGGIHNDRKHSALSRDATFHHTDTLLQLDREQFVVEKAPRALRMLRDLGFGPCEIAILEPKTQIKARPLAAKTFRIRKYPCGMNLVTGSSFLQNFTQLRHFCLISKIYSLIGNIHPLK